MAIINGEVPRPERLRARPATVVVRIVWPLNAPADYGEQIARQLREALGRELRPYFSGPLRVRGEPTPAQLQFREFLAFDAKPEEAEALAERLRARRDVQSAYVAAGPQPPPSETTVVLTHQDYLDAAPKGIDARWTWSNAAGEQVGFVDLEQGWNLTHSDLSGAGITLMSGSNKAYPGHGSAALGIVVAVNNTFGGTGVAPDSKAQVISEWRPDGTHNVADAIKAAAEDMDAGDVLLLESQTLSFSGGAHEAPVEVEDAIFVAIKAAVEQDIVVVECAGNGSANLDSHRSHEGKATLRRGNGRSYAFDSGAIMVAASDSSHPYTRLPMSNFGSRIDCFAWGQGIETCGDGWMSGAGYTHDFGGTSGATAIVAGAALLLQAWAKKYRSGGVFLPEDVRRLLSEPGLNTKSQNGAADGIGVMPDLRAIITAQ